MGLDTCDPPAAILRQGGACGPWESPWPRCCRAVDGPVLGLDPGHQRRWQPSPSSTKLFHLHLRPNRTVALMLGVTSALNRWPPGVEWWGCSSVGSATLRLLSGDFRKPACSHASPTSTRTFNAELPSHYRFSPFAPVFILAPSIPRFLILRPSRRLATPSARMRLFRAWWVHTASQFARADRIANLVPPIHHGGGRAAAYRKRILAGVWQPSGHPWRRPLHTLADVP